MNDTRPAPPALLSRIRDWVRSDMLVLRWVLLALYFVIVGGLISLFWFGGGDRLIILFFVVLSFGCQALFIFGGGTMHLRRPIRKRRLWMPVLVAALMFGVLAVVAGKKCRMLCQAARLTLLTSRVGKNDKLLDFTF